MAAYIHQHQCLYLVLLFLLGLLTMEVSCSRLLNEQTLLERHEKWTAHHGRIYADAIEKEKRFKIFKENVKRIETFNGGVDKGYKLGVNKFADLTNEEFIASYGGYKKKSPNVSAAPLISTSFRYANVSDFPMSIDWRKEGAVTPVKNQGSCGCCWAFSAVAAMEGINQIKTGNLICLSEQQLLDCDVDNPNGGCNGGNMKLAFKFIQENGGITTEANYPYMGQEGNCNTEMSSNPAMVIMGYESVPPNNENALLQAVAHQPVSIGVDAKSYEFQFYASGVFKGECGANMNHAITAVGYGSIIDDNNGGGDGTKYWLMKNSWGTSWGQDGYIMMQRDFDAPEGICGIARDASYPIVA